MSRNRRSETGSRIRLPSRQPAVSIGDPITADNGVDPDQPSTLLEVPRPKVMVELLDVWASRRKSGRILLVLDVSGSMGEPGSDGGETKLELAREAIIGALDDFKDDDDVGLRIFTTGLGSGDPDTFVDTVPLSPIAANRESMADASQGAPAPQRDPPVRRGPAFATRRCSTTTTPSESTRWSCSPTA